MALDQFMEELWKKLTPVCVFDEKNRVVYLREGQLFDGIAQRYLESENYEVKRVKKLPPTWLVEGYAPPEKKGIGLYVDIVC